MSSQQSPKLDFSPQNLDPLKSSFSFEDGYKLDKMEPYELVGAILGLAGVGVIVVGVSTAGGKGNSGGGYSSMSFDFSILQVIPALMAGGGLVTAGAIVISISNKKGGKRYGDDFFTD